MLIVIAYTPWYFLNSYQNHPNYKTGQDGCMYVRMSLLWSGPLCKLKMREAKMSKEQGHNYVISSAEM